MKTITLFSILLFSFSSAWAYKYKDGKATLESLEDYNVCQSQDYSGGECHDALLRWVKTKPADAFQAGKLTRKHMNHQAALPFFDIAFKNKKGNCKDEDVQMAVMAGIALPDDGKGGLLEKARHIGMDLCKTELRSKILTAAEEGGYPFKNFCKDLIKEGKIKGIRAQECTEE